MSVSSSPSRPGTALPGLFTQLLQHREAGVAILLGITIATVAIVNPDFLGLVNLRDVLVNNAAYAIIACGVTFVIVTGEIDISVGSLAGLCAAVLGVLTSPDRLSMHPLPAVAIVMALGLTVGVINGFLVAFARVPSIIVTLGMLTALKGVTDLLMGGEWIEVIRPLRALGSPAIAIGVAAIVVALAMMLATRTPIGRRIYAVGSNVHAARLAGLSPRLIKLLVFAITGLLVTVATLVDATRLPQIESGYGVGWELFIVTAVIVGGTSISGGKGTIIGTILAVLLLGLVRPVLTFMKLGDEAVYWERAIQGAFILAAVLADHVGRRRSPEGVE
jgi:ribose/xylose/arabinose/galactoside ABC-type transport system permease subunit